MYKLLCFAKTPKAKTKYQVDLINTETNKVKTIKFGLTGYGDYTTFNESSSKSADEHKRRYILRHQKREDWTESGILTRGFWSKNISWNKRTLEESLNDTIKRFNLD